MLCFLPSMNISLNFVFIYVRIGSIVAYYRLAHRSVVNLYCQQKNEENDEYQEIVSD